MDKAYFELQSTHRGFYVFCVATADQFYLEWTIAGDSKPTVAIKYYRPLSPPRDELQGSSRGGRLSYGCIYKTHSFPKMLVSISMCVFSKILKYRTLYSKFKMSLNREKLLTNHVNMSTISAPDKQRICVYYAI